MEEPLYNVEHPLNTGSSPRRDPLYRTRQVMHTKHNDMRRNLQHIDERAEFDDDGLHRLIDEEIMCLDCNCNFAKTMAGQCLFCAPPSRLCPDHFLHCETCGRGMCIAHTTIIIDSTSGKQKFYCPKHKNWIKVKCFLRRAVLTLLSPLITYDRKH